MIVLFIRVVGFVLHYNPAARLKFFLKLADTAKAIGHRADRMTLVGTLSL